MPWAESLRDSASFLGVILLANALAFALYPGAHEQWDAFPPSARRAILGWIALARTAPTRAKRINETAERASRGERANQWPRA